MSATASGGTTLVPPAPRAAANLPPQGQRPSRTQTGRPQRRRLLRGPADDPAWARPALLALLGATAVLYLWGLGASGWANSYYSAAVQAGTTSWKAFFFGAFDPAAYITVDKPPASLWVMSLSARIFGVNSWSILVPQTLEGVAAVGLLYATVRRRFSPAAGLLAGAALAVTPAATLMFRFNNPDALLTLLLVGAAFAVTRAAEAGRARWLVLAGTLIGFGFLTKMLQALLVVPGFALVYLLAAPTSLRRRITGLLAGGAALLVSASWWVAVVALTPAADRPYIGGSQHNSILELIFGYNGLGRLNGDEVGSVGGGGGAGGRWGQTGWGRLFGAEMGGQIAWLLPAALIFLTALVWLTWRVPRTDQGRAAVLLWGSWLVLTALVFSFAKGIIHAYYTVVLAPPIAALVAIGAVGLWRQRRLMAIRLLLAGTLAVTAAWAWELLGRAPGWQPWLRALALVTGLVSAAVILAPPAATRRLAGLAATGGLATALAGPLAWSVATAAVPHTGALPSAGPAVAAGSFAGRGPGVCQPGCRAGCRARRPG